MRTNFMKNLMISVCCFVLLLVSSQSVISAPPIPNPVLVFNGQEPYRANGKEYIRYSYFVFNRLDYPAQMFAAAPDLPPCGTNKTSSRTWVDVFDQRGVRLYGFCAFGSPDNLGEVSFHLEAGVVPPSWVYIELNDRKTNTKYKSNLAETTL
jgi:hypothetical protein